MKLPTPIQTFFNADQDTDGAPPICAFEPDAIVKDENKTHVGLSAIESWWRAAKAANQHSTQPREAHEKNGHTIVKAVVTGNFPGSPATLNFSFQLKNNRISELEIGA